MMLMVTMMRMLRMMMIILNKMMMMILIRMMTRGQLIISRAGQLKPAGIPD